MPRPYRNCPSMPSHTSPTSHPLPLKYGGLERLVRLVCMLHDFYLSPPPIRPKETNKINIFLGLKPLTDDPAPANDKEKQAKANYAKQVGAQCVSQRSDFE
ncbi:hypothetical protein EI94DRAFT_233305 [Lactarius quietus]|nr:hypothetical protein EI94DRAFT_233305 [Lactarius quietus]